MVKSRGELNPLLPASRAHKMAWLLFFIPNCSYRLLGSFLQERQLKGNPKPHGFGGPPAAKVQPIDHSLGTKATEYFTFPLTTSTP